MISPADLRFWPLAGLRVSSGDLELSWADDAALFALANLAALGVHDEGFMPFLTPWTRGTPEQVGRSVLQYNWGQRARLSPDDWDLQLAVRLDGQVVGVQGAFATSFRTTRVAETGSWLGVTHQGSGLGTRMRVLVLHLLFDGLGARVAETAAFEDNGPSNGVTRKLGYADNGRRTVAREGAPVEENRYRLTREQWDARPESMRPAVEMAGVEAVRELLDIN